MELTRFKRMHIPDVLSWIRNEADMVQWAGPIFDWPVTQKQFRGHLQAANLEPPTLYPFGLYHRKKIIGYCELSNHNRKLNSALVSRVIVCPKKRDRRYGQFMVRGLLEFGFEGLGLHRIGLGVFDFNKAAVRCYTKAGFTLEGTLRESAQVGDSYWNCHLMSIMQREWGD